MSKMTLVLFVCCDLTSASDNFHTQINQFQGYGAFHLVACILQHNVSYTSSMGSGPIKLH